MAKPNMTATGKSVNMKWTGPAATMLEQLEAIHSAGAMREVSPGKSGVGYLRSSDILLAAQLTKVKVGSRVVSKETGSYALTWAMWATMISSYTDCNCTYGKETVEVLEVEALAQGEDGNNITLRVGAPYARAEVSGVTLTGGGMQAGAVAGVDLELGEPTIAGCISVDGRSVSLPQQAAAPALPAMAHIMCGDGLWDTEGLVVEVGGVEVRGGGQGIIGNINAMQLGVVATAGEAGQPYIVLTAESPGAWGNQLEVSARYEVAGEGEVSGYAVASGAHLSGGADEGWAPAAQAWGWIGAADGAGLDWAEQARLWVNGIALEREDGEQLYETINRYTHDGLLGNAGLIAEPRSYLPDPESGTRASGWIHFEMAPAASGWLRINGVAVDLGKDSASPEEWADAINGAGCGVTATKRGDTNYVDLEAEETGAAGNSITLDSSVGGQPYMPVSGDYLSGGRDGGMYRTYVRAAVPGAAGNNIRMTLVLGGAYAGMEDVGQLSGGCDMTAAPARTRGEVLAALAALASDRVTVESDAVGGVRVSAGGMGAWGNELEVEASGCFARVDGTYPLEGGADAGETKARGTIRIYDWSYQDVGLYVGGQKVTWDSKGGKPGSGEWDKALEATGLVRVLSHTSEAQHVLTMTAKAAGPEELEVSYHSNGGEATCWPVRGGEEAQYEVDYSEAGAPPELTLQPYPNSSVRGYCWEITSTMTRQPGEIAELQTEWQEMWYEYEDKETAEEEEDTKDKTEEEKEEETVGESEDNPEIITDRTGVLESILTHPAAAQYTEGQMMACHAYMGGKGLDDKIAYKGKKVKIRDLWPKNWLGELILKHVWEYYVPHTVVRRQWKGRGNPGKVCQIGHASGLPPAGSNRNWMCMGNGIEKRGADVSKSDTWELSSPGGWNVKLYSGES